jgi:hypothetical protein
MDTIQKAAIIAIQGVIVQARLQAYHAISHAQIAALLDMCEYLPSLLLEDKWSPDLFRQALYDIASKFPYNQYLLDAFDKVHDAESKS